MCGVAFSGKSTLAKKIAEAKNAILVSQDEHWFERKMEWNLDHDSDEDWERILTISRDRAEQELMAGHSVVFDDISLKYSDRYFLRSLARENDAESILVYLDTPREVQEERKLQNFKTKERHDVPQHIIDWGISELEIPQEEERPFIFKPSFDVSDWLSRLP